MTATDIGLIVLALTLTIGMILARLYYPYIGCSHSRVRCIHGDEIIHRGMKRRACLDCGRAIEGPLPRICTVTGIPHHEDD